MMNRFSITGKLFLIVGLLNLGQLMNGGLGIVGTYRLSETLHAVTDETLPATRNLILIDMLHEGFRSVASDVMWSKTVSDLENKEKQVQDLLSKSNLYFQELQNTLQEGQVGKQIPHLQKEFSEYAQMVSGLVVQKRNEIQSVKSELSSPQLFQGVNEKFELLEKSLLNLGKEFEKENLAVIQEKVKTAGFWNWISICVLIATILAGGLLAIVISRYMKQSLGRMASILSDGAGSIGSAIQTLSSISSNLSVSSTQQASAIEETAASVEEISSMVTRSKENAQNSERVTLESKDKAEQGQTTMQRMVDAIGEIQKNNENVRIEMQQNNEQLNEIQKVIQEIEGKTRVINDIVFQTKLLSFNASVEAARAGEQGKGFAVVAEEVGNLARMSGAASQEITALLEQSTKRVSGIIEESKQRIEYILTESRKTVDQGTAVAKEFQDVLHEIVEGSNEVSIQVSGIAQASSEQANGVSEITKAINQLNQSTHVNADGARRCSESTLKLTQEVKNVRTVSDQLKQFVEGRVSVSRFVWKDDYSLRIKEMDDEHKVLIERINDLAGEIEKANGRSSAGVRNAFKQLASYTVKHFQDEEAFLQSFQYPDFRKHQSIHHSLLATVGRYGEMIEKGKYDASDLMNFLNDWLLTHILNVDMKYSDHVHAHKVHRHVA